MPADTEETSKAIILTGKIRKYEGTRMASTERADTVSSGAFTRDEGENALLSFSVSVADYESNRKYFSDVLKNWK